jgi:hypothetical protein
LGKRVLDGIRERDRKGDGKREEKRRGEGREGEGKGREKRRRGEEGRGGEGRGGEERRGEERRGMMSEPAACPSSSLRLSNGCIASCLCSKGLVGFVILGTLG